MNNWSGFFELLGILFTCLLLLVMAYLIFTGLTQAIVWFGAWIRHKRRFAKPPTAQCYCRDCIHYNCENHHCAANHGWNMADNWFCWRATKPKIGDD